MKGGIACIGAVIAALSAALMVFPWGDTFWMFPYSISQITGALLVTGLNTNYHIAVPGYLFAQTLSPISHLFIFWALNGFLFFQLLKDTGHKVSARSVGLLFSAALLLLSIEGVSLLSALGTFSVLLCCNGISSSSLGNSKSAFGYVVAASLLFPNIFILCFLFSLLVSLGIGELRTNKLRFQEIGTILFLSAISICITAHPDLFHFSPVARFVPGTGTALGIDPLVGLPPERPSIDQLWIQSRIIPFIFLSLALCAVSYILKLRSTLVASLIIFAALVVDSGLLSNTIRVVGPIAAISRIVPFALYVPVTLLLVIALIILAVIAAVQCARSESKRRIDWLTSAAMICIACIGQFYLSHYFGYPSEPVRHTADSRLNSPSLYTIKESLPLPLKIKMEVIRILQRDIDRATASTNEAMLPEIFDRRGITRWSTKPATQRGGEWVEVTFKNTYQITGLSIGVPNYNGDFPRGITVFGGLKDATGTCTPTTTLYKENWWRGAVVTMANGFQSLAPENDVDLYFAAPASVDCIKLLQTGSDKTYEWSIESLSVFEIQKR